ncbi:sorting nexin-32-like, partial [Polyodon spathula]|uniref:sorting nexin-32-like n=1 Tax=Polyodon spathula TaxID=7913 RepID=UPI001B7EB025
MNESQALFVGEDSKSVSVDLHYDSRLQVEISDAVSERDKVKFTVHTKTSLPRFKRVEFSVVRQHEEFIWLHDTYLENEDYAGIKHSIPPAPPKPDFEASREKLQKLGEGDGTMTREEFAKMKQELEAEYLAIFKKTVAMHEVFLQRLAAHPVLRRDHNFYVFLEYDQDLSVRGKNRKEIFGGFFKNMVKTADEALIASTSGLKEVDEFFDHERTFLLEYHVRVKEASLKADRMTRSHKNVAEGYIPVSSALSSLGTQESSSVNRNFLKLAELFEKLRVRIQKP